MHAKRLTKYVSFDATYLYQVTFILLYNVVFTSLPVIALGGEYLGLRVKNFNRNTYACGWSSIRPRLECSRVHGIPAAILSWYSRPGVY